MSISTTLAKIPNTYTVGNLEWSHFVKDHIANLLANSREVHLDINELQKYRFRPRLLFTQYNIEGSDAWIVLLINNIQASTGIPYYVTKLMVPNPTFINWLKEQYSAYTAAIKH